VRPHLEYAIPVWNPSLQQDISELEKVQRRATKMSPQLRKLTYEKRLEILGLTTLETRRERGDLIQFYSILTNRHKVIWIKEPRSIRVEDGNPIKGMRRHAKTYYKEHPCTLNARQNFFTNRTVNSWNELPGPVKDSESLNTFKARLDKLPKFKV
jgi:hypothetical protein